MPAPQCIPASTLPAPFGTPIYATADGTVLRAGWNSGGYGNLVEIDHGRGIETRYGHLSAILVHAGDHVTRGQQVGRMGSTGRSTGNHLHYEVRIDGRAVNPIPFMKSTDYVLAMQRRANAALDGIAGDRRPAALSASLPLAAALPIFASVSEAQIALTENAAKRVAWIAERQSQAAGPAPRGRRRRLRRLHLQVRAWRAGGATTPSPKPTASSWWSTRSALISCAARRSISSRTSAARRSR